VPNDGRKWDRRLDRAHELADANPFARQILLFYSHLTVLQRDIYLQMPASYASRGAGRYSLPARLDDIDVGILLPRWGPFLKLLEGIAPAPLAQFAQRLRASGPAAGASYLRSAWPAAGINPLQASAIHPCERFCTQAFLQPFAEFLADHTEVPVPHARLPICPYCGSAPLVGALRPEGEGGKRTLICSFCRTEWDYLRIACPACDERREQKLCVYISPKFEFVRVEACETCKAYLKTVDLTRTGLAVPEVDELASVPLTLWADENGYHKATLGIFFL